MATQEGHEAKVRALIDAGSDVNKAKNGWFTPLFMAAQYGQEAVLRALIKAGADIN
jgi:ankyrin repeat protein